MSAGCPNHAHGPGSGAARTAPSWFTRRSRPRAPGRARRRGPPAGRPIRDAPCGPPPVRRRAVPAIRDATPRACRPGVPSRGTPSGPPSGPRSPARSGHGRGRRPTPSRHRPGGTLAPPAPDIVEAILGGRQPATPGRGARSLARTVLTEGVGRFHNLFPPHAAVPGRAVHRAGADGQGAPGSEGEHGDRLGLAGVGEGRHERKGLGSCGYRPVASGSSGTAIIPMLRGNELSESVSWKLI